MSPSTISPATAQQWLDEGSAVLLDVREPAEYRTVHIGRASLMPLGQLDAAKLTSQKKIVVHCQKGARGGAACLRLLSKNPDLEVYNMTGGIEAWSAAGLPVERSGRGVLSLDRQVQLAIGLLLLIATSLSLVMSPAWIWAAGLVGLGLTVAGLTGFCGMAILMARMPWHR